MAKTVFDVLKDKLNEQIESATLFLQSGGPKDFAQYKEAYGLIRGLQTAQQHITDLERTYTESEYND
jgi:uncharacterized protein (UPF0297 family)